MITSTSNAQVKHVIQLQKKSKLRNTEDVFLVEGQKMFEEAPKERVVKAYIATSLYEELGAKLNLEGIEYELVEDRIFRAMSDTQTPQGILCIVKRESYDLETLLEMENPLLLLLENLQDPGNLGTIVRTAEGAGVDGIILSRECVDLYNPKTIRSTMGSIYRMPVLDQGNLVEVVGQLHEKKIHTYAAHLSNSRMYDQPSYIEGTAFLIGNEGNGLTKELSELAGEYIKIPMAGQLESLNAAIAASILMYEANRQRR